MESVKKSIEERDHSINEVKHKSIGQNPKSRIRAAIINDAMLICRYQPIYEEEPSLSTTTGEINFFATGQHIQTT
ncbi:hypothetical protein Tco_0821368 [Tanacetum coccineum]|uniref:Uncharacterized protein n=1 Tax=Tanacetum coccineum TaxID=301880 RepID=A0ABQ5ADU2_9ASTR